MIRKLTKVFLGFTLLWLGLASKVEASHTFGGDMSYTFVAEQNGYLIYKISMKIYIDRSKLFSFGTPRKGWSEPFQTIGIYKNDTVVDGFTGNKTIALYRTKDLYTPNKPGIDTGTVSLDFPPGCTFHAPITILRALYEDTIMIPKTAPGAAKGFNIIYGLSARIPDFMNSGTLLNIHSDGSNTGQTFYAYIPPLSVHNNSAAFSKPPLPYVCTSDTSSANNNATDVDGDKLVYSFIVPLDDAFKNGGGGGAPNTVTVPIVTVTYMSGYSFPQPLGASGYAFIDNSTGTTKYLANTQGVYAMAVEIREYRNGILVGVTTRDIEITSQPCATSVTPPTYTSSNGQTEFYVKEGKSLCFPITITESDATQKIRVSLTGDLITSPSINPKPVITGPDSAYTTLTKNFCWSTICGQGKPDPYAFVMTVRAGCSPQTKDIGFKIHVNPVKPVYTAQKQLVCKFEQVTYTVADSTGSSYQWFITGGTSNVTTGKSIQVTWDLTSPTGRVICKETTAEGCSGSDTLLITRDDNKLRVSAGGSSKTICPNDSTITIGPPAGSPTGTYVWKPATGLNHAAMPNPKVFLNNTTTTTYTAKYTLDVYTPDGCFSHDSVYVIVRPLPAITATTTIPNNSICLGSSITLQATGANNYSWYLPPGNTPIGIGVSISVSPSITSTYAVVGTDAAGCSGSASVVVTVNPLPSVLIEAIGKDTLCVGDALTLLGINATTYAWTSSTSGATVIATGNTLNINPTLTTTYTLTGTDGNGCSNTYKKQIVVNPLPAPTLVVSNSPLCPGDSSVLRVQDRAHYTFVWSIQGTTNTPLSTPIDSTIKVGPTLTTIYAVQATNKLTHCVGTTTFALIVNPKPQPQGISGFTSVCPGQTGLSYSMVNPSSGSSYTWLVKGGYKPAGQLQTTATIQINWNNAVDLHGYVKVVEQNSYHCKGDTITLPVTIDYNLHPPLPLGSDSLCSHDVNNSLYQVIPVAGYTYTWMVQGGTVAGTAGLNDCQVSVNWDANTGIAHTLSYSETNGTCYGVSLAKTVRIDPSPAASMVVGLSGVCKREQTAYTLNDLAGSTYSWHLSQHTRAVIVGNQTGPQVLINWPDTIHPTVDTLFVVETSNKGCVGPLLVKPITITPPHQPAKILGADFVCVGSNPANAPVVLYTAHLGLATSRYVWTVIGADKVADSKDSVLSVRFTHVTPGGYVTLNVYELSKDSCPGLTVSKQVKFDYTTPYMQQVTTQISNAHYLQVRWDSSFNANGVSRTYRLYRRRLHGNGAWTDLGTLYANSYLDTVVNTGQYAYQYGYSTLDLCEDTVKAPVHNSILLQATAQEASNMVVLNWTPYQNWRGGVQQYELWRKLDQEHDYTRYRVLTGSDTVVSYQNGADGFKHSYRVLAVEGNTGGQSRVSWSNTANVSFEHLIDIPTVITPNGDGVNDTWVIKNIETYKNVEVQVFNRWGNEVFHNSGLYANPWNGTANGQQLPDGAYFFVIKLNQTQANTNQNVFQGTLSIIR